MQITINCAVMEYSPMSISCSKLLTDKLYEKRKIAALEIEKLVKEYFSTNNLTLLAKLLQVLGRLTTSQDVNYRKGGLIGLAAFSIALGKDSSSYLYGLIKPVLGCFHDLDSRVRYYACESLYNIVKVTRNGVLQFFSDIFDGLSKLASDSDQHVRSGFDLLDCLLKDIVSESSGFDLPSFVPLLRERLYSKCHFARHFVVTWIIVLDENPEVDMLIYLPDILDGLFLILSDSGPEIRHMCETCLGEFLYNVHKSKDEIDLSKMINVLIVHSQSKDALTQFTAFIWLKEFISCMDFAILPHISSILSATLPCLSCPDNKLTIRETACQVNLGLMNFCDLLKFDSQELQNEEQAKIDQLNLAVVLAILAQQLTEGSVATQIAAIEWMTKFFNILPDETFVHMEKLLPVFIKQLKDMCDEVVILILKLVTNVCKSSSCKERPSPIPKNITFTSSQGINDFFVLFLYEVIILLRNEKDMPRDRVSFIIKQLCILLNSRDVLCCCSEILSQEVDIIFASQMTEIFSFILLTSPELSQLRINLKNLKSEESKIIFKSLYRSWSHNPIATVALCFLSQSYKHAYELLALMEDVEVNVHFLMEIDLLIQMLESPIFSYLRMQLLEPQKNKYLVRSLYSLLMLLPQSDAFYTLKHRLQCIPQTPFGSPDEDLGNKEDINFGDLLQHFKNIREMHRQAKNQIKC